jgi:hypothetical protein
MNNQMKQYDELTYRGLMVLRIMGNGTPSLSQMEFAQGIVSLIGEEGSLSLQLTELISKFSTQSRETLKRDTLYSNAFSQDNYHKKQGVS